MTSPPPSPDAAAIALLDEAVGYLNFSAGTSDPKFLGNLNGLYRAIESQVPPEEVLPTLARWLTEAVDRLQQEQGGVRRFEASAAP